MYETLGSPRTNCFALWRNVKWHHIEEISTDFKHLASSSILHAITYLPKSHNLRTAVSGSTRRFCGLMSLWQTPWEWMYAKLRNNWYIYTCQTQTRNVSSFIYILAFKQHVFYFGYIHDMTGGYWWFSTNRYKLIRLGNKSVIHIQVKRYLL